MSAIIVFTALFGILMAQSVARMPYFNLYKNVTIKSGIFIGSHDLNGDILGQFHCIKLCYQDSRCLFVVHTLNTTSICTMWAFNQTRDFEPVLDETSTTYGRRDSEFFYTFFSSKFCINMIGRYRKCRSLRYSQELKR